MVKLAISSLITIFSTICHYEIVGRFTANIIESSRPAQFEQAATGRNFQVIKNFLSMSQRTILSNGSVSWTYGICHELTHYQTTNFRFFQIERVC